MMFITLFIGPNNAQKSQGRDHHKDGTLIVYNLLNLIVFLK